MKRIPFFADLLLRSFFVFLLAFLWASFTTRSFGLSFLIAFLVTCLVNGAIYFFQSKKRTKKLRTRERVDHMNEIALQFKFMHPSESTTLIKSALPKTEHESSVPDEYYSLLHKDIVGVEDIIQRINQTKVGRKTIIIANEFGRGVREFFDGLRLDVELMSFEKLYDEILEPANIMPAITIEKKNKSRVRLQHLRNLFLNRRRAKSFAFVGVFILLSSFIVRPTLYYVIVASIVFGLALASLLLDRRDV